MTRVKIEPGICGLNTIVISEYDEDENTVKIKIHSACEAVQAIIPNLGDTFDPFEVCLVKPGLDPFTAFASETFPGHASCPTIAGIIKCIEVSAGLALPKDATIRFEAHEK